MSIIHKLHAYFKRNAFECWQIKSRQKKKWERERETKRQKKAPYTTNTQNLRFLWWILCNVMFSSCIYSVNSYIPRFQFNWCRDLNSSDQRKNLRYSKKHKLKSIHIHRHTAKKKIISLGKKSNFSGSQNCTYFFSIYNISFVFSRLRVNSFFFFALYSSAWTFFCLTLK